MIENALKQKWASGQGTLNGWLSIGNAFTAEIMAAQGYDSLCIDIQHGFLDYGNAMGMLQAVRASGVVPLVRVPWNEPGIIMKALDAGAYGIICPMVNSAEEAAALVRSVRYPPHGARSFGPTRANYAAGPGYAAEANTNILAFAMIETAEAVENVEAICATPGLDGVYIGPADLTLGVTQGRLPPGFDREEDEMIAVIKRILAAAQAAGIRAALHCMSPAYAAQAIGWGFNMTTLSADARLLAAAASASLSEARALIGAGQAEAPRDKTGY
ncbi:MAG: aldolase/citrate lyase family protein [Pseudomonadota bacterium]